jgi:hypothetical protein
MACCPPRGAEPFTEKLAQRDLRRFRKRGLDPAARALANALSAAGGTVLEIGGGLGTLHLELLDRGATRATNIELSPAYESTAAELVRERDAEGRVDRHVGNFAVMGGKFDAADVVVLHRVVCCTPDVDGVVGAAAAHARRTLGLTFPVDAWWMRAVAAFLNLGAWVFGWQWRFFVHRHDAIAGAADRAGLRREQTLRRRIWCVAVFGR